MAILVAVDADGEHHTRVGLARRDKAPAALLGYGDEGFLACLLVQIGEVDGPILEAAHLLELFLDPSPALQSQLQVLLHVVLGELAIGMEELDQP
jgi:hypothetical protein